MAAVATLQRGSVPLLVSCPHDGTYLPPDLARRLSPAALATPDTDWHVARLYDFVVERGASLLVPRASRYVVDVNRDRAGAALYPGADETGLVPTSTFAREPLYSPGDEPDAREIAERVTRWYDPYHALLADEVARLHAEHGVAVLLDAHSIRSRVPRFFDGELPDLNFGTASGASAAPDLCDDAFAALARADGLSAVRDGRFKGGYITRHYGAPGRGVHAVQLELAQHTYMDEAPPYRFMSDRAARVLPVLHELVGALLAWAKREAARA